MSHSNRYRSAYFRTTLLPFAAVGESAAIVQSATEGSCGALADLLGSGPVSAALENASPSLFTRLTAELAAGSIKPKTASSLLNYLSRMATRCTPFGLMSGVVPAAMAEGASLDLQALAPSDWLAFPRISYERTFRAVRNALRARIERSDDFAVRLSHTLECRDGRVKVMGFHHPDGSITPAFDEIAIDPPLAAVLQGSRRWIEVSTLAGILSGQLADVTIAEARGYVLELLECGVLQDAFYPSLDPRHPVSPGTLEACGQDPRLEQLSRALERASHPLPVGEMSRSTVREIAHRAAAQLNRDDPTDPDTPGGSVSIGSGTDPVDGTALQIDMLVRASDSSVGAILVEEALHSIALLSRLRRPDSTRLDALKEEFARKFGEDSVSLLRAVAPDDGLSLNRFVDNRPAHLVALPIDRGTPSRDAAPWSPLDAMMLERFIAARTAGSGEILLHREDLEPFLAAPVEKPVRSGYALFSAYRRLPEADESATPPSLLVFQSASSGAAASISARFAHLDPGLESAYRECFAAEHRDDVVDADILYLPSARIGNVSCRPPALEYQIPIFGYAVDDGCKAIDLGDLYLRLDPREGFVLTSRTLGKRVRPLLASAHNYLHPECAPVYQFLALLDQQDSESPVADLLSFARQQGETPAVRLGSLVLSPRTWFINTRQMDVFRSAPEPAMALRVHLEAIGINRFVRFGRGDNLITFDLACAIYLDMLLDEKELSLQQAIPDGYEPACRGDDGLRQVELAVQYVDATPAFKRALRGESLVESVTHPHGFGDWNYLKLYGSPHAIDTWIGPISETAGRLRTGKRITAWHFVRYRDPDPHLRVRWRCADAGDRAVLDLILSSLAGCASPMRTCADTFFPETFRYGGPDVIETIYDLFTIDSAFVAGLLKSEHAGAAEGRVKLGVASARALARGMGLDDREIAALWDTMTSAFVGEFGGTHRSQLKRQLGGLWRNWRTEILDTEAHFSAPLERYAASLAEALARSGAWGEKMTRSRLEICADVIHMHSNRLYLDHSRENEMCCYALAFHLESARRFRS